MKRQARFNLSLSSSLGILIGIVLTAFMLSATGQRAQASNPSSGTLSPTAANPVTWVGTATGGVAPNAEADCQEGSNCDSFSLTLSGNPSDWAGKVVHVRIDWLTLAHDYALSVHKGSNSDPVVAFSDNPIDSPRNWEAVVLDPSALGTGLYTVRVIYFAATSADQYRASASVGVKPEGGQSNETPPRYLSYHAPGGMGTGAAEPTLGVNWSTGKVMYIAGTETLQVTFDDSGSPARSTWLNKSALLTSINTNDPILFTDSDIGATRTNRTFVSQLQIGTKQSLMAFTDDDGETWTPSQGSGINSGVDHQTVGGGPYALNNLGIGPRTPYPHAVYYASQDIGMAQIARSDDGGQTFGLAVPMWDVTQAGGLHGHIKVAADGTIYVPNKDLKDAQGVAVSEDNGLTWTLRKVPGSQVGRTDPSIGIGTDGTIYFGYANGNGHPRIAVSRDKGRTWQNDQDVGTPFNIQNTVFPAVAAGDANRAAYFFLGTSTPGAGGVGTDRSFTGAWYGFIATTYDGGRTWITVNATSGDPVQRGVICTSGTTCPSGTRNLLDFNDLTVDKQGRVLAAFADGCVTGDCIQGKDKNNDGRIDSNDNDGTEVAAIIRQVGGKPLFAAYDPPQNATPAAPFLMASIDHDDVSLTWTTPDDNGSPITGYKLYRGVEGGAETLIATLSADDNSYIDSTPNGGSFYYRVTALNANGEGASSSRVVPAITESPCQGAGITVLTDPSGDERAALPAHDIRSVHIAEPYFTDGSNKLVFTMKVGSLNSLTPATTWRTFFDGPDATSYFIDMRTDALGAVTFKYGTFVWNADGTAGAATTVGDADAGSRYDAASGVITIIVSNSKVGNPGAGQALSAIFMRTIVGAVVPDNANYPSTNRSIVYTLIGNAACQLRPAAPSNLTAAGGRKNEIRLEWRDNSDNEHNFHVERSQSPDGGFVEIATLNANATSYVDRSTVKKQTYYYRVRASNPGGRSPYSNVAGRRAK